MTDHKTYYRLLVSKTQTEPTITEYLNTYLSENTKIGYLVFDVHQNSPVRGRIPIPNAKITISKLLGDDYYFSKIITTNENGETVPVPLPTVSRELSLQPGEGRVYSTYLASVEAPGYQRQDIFDVEIFEGITAVQHVDMQPSVANRRNRAGSDRASVG